MTKWHIVAAAACVLLWLAIPPGCGCDDEQDAGVISAAMADKLSGALGFENAEEVEGAPPDGHAGDQGYPQITSIEAPQALAAGQAFTVSLSTDFGSPGAVIGAVVYVENATKYLKVKSPVDAASLVMRLAGMLKGDSELLGKLFTLKIAMYDGNTAAGNYGTWHLEVKKAGETAPTTQQLQTSMQIEGGGSAKSGGIPPGIPSPEAPQVLSIEAPDLVGPGRQFEVVVIYHAGKAPVAALDLQVDNSTMYYEVPAQGVPDQDGNTVLKLTFDPAKLGTGQGGLHTAARALTTATVSSGLVAQMITLLAALVDEQGTRGLVKRKDIGFTTETGACEGKGCPVQEADGGTDASIHDAGGDTGIEPGRDAGHDAGADAAVPLDAGDDGGIEPERDTGHPELDGGIDAGKDAGGDAGGPDAGGGTCGSCSPSLVDFPMDGNSQVSIMLTGGADAQSCDLVQGQQSGGAILFTFTLPDQFTASTGQGFSIVSASGGTVSPEGTSWSQIPSGTWLVLVLRDARNFYDATLTLQLVPKGEIASLEVQQVCFDPSKV